MMSTSLFVNLFLRCLGGLCLWGNTTIPSVAQHIPYKELEPSTSMMAVPFWGMTTNARVGFDDYPLGNLKHGGFVQGGYWWGSNPVYHPKTEQLLLSNETSNFWASFYRYYLRLSEPLSIGLSGYATGGGLLKAGGYDDGLTGGASLVGGPLIGLDLSNDMDWPTSGFMGEFQVSSGYHRADNNDFKSFLFGLMSLTMTEYIPLGQNRTIAMHGVYKMAWPQLAWTDKFSAGGNQYLRGFNWNRFSGDRLLILQTEFRDQTFPDIYNLNVFDFFTASVGIGYLGFVDVGRVWENQYPVSLSQLGRYSVGGGLLVFANQTPRLQLLGAWCADGFSPITTVGMSF
jgi:hypothetical protein